MTIATLRLVTFASAAVLAACSPTAGSPRPIRLTAATVNFDITFDPTPAYAREKVQFKVVVRDRKSGQPVENGVGQIYANTEGETKKVYDALVPGSELGAYYGTLNFLTSETWAIGVRFHADSTKPLETVQWMQDVKPSRTPY